MSGVGQAARLDEVNVLVRLLRVGRGRRARNRSGRVEDPVAGVPVPRAAAGRAAHHLEQLGVRQRRPQRPDGRGGTRDERCGEARPVEDPIGRTGRVERLRDRDRDVLAWRGQVHLGGGGREVRCAAAFVRRADRQHVRERGRVGGRAALLPAVPGGGDHERAVRERGQDRVLLHRQPVGATKAEVDHAGTVGDSRREPSDLVAHGEHATRARVPDLQLRLRVDADNADAVRRRPDNRGGRGPVQLLGIGRRDCLRVERGRLRPRGELLV